jgi:hypothetical protein
LEDQDGERQVRLSGWRALSLKIAIPNSAAPLRGEVFDPNRHMPRGEIKAVTYHQLAVEKLADEWRARIIFDV